MKIEEIVRQIVESRKCSVGELEEVTSSPSFRMPNNLKTTALLSEVEQSFKIFDGLKSEVDKNLKGASRGKKVKYIDEKIKEIRSKYKNCNTEESIQDWPLDILAYRLIEGKYDLDLKYFAEQLVYNFSPGKNYGYQFENELKNIALGVAEHKLLLELEIAHKKLLKESSRPVSKIEIKNTKITEKDNGIKRNDSIAIQIRIAEYIVSEIYDGLKEYFDKSQHELLLATLSGQNEKPIPLVFTKKAGRYLLELFRRLSYNKCINENKTVLGMWIVHHFAYIENRNNKNRGKERPFDRDYVRDCLSKEKGDVRKAADRICNIPQLTYYTPEQLTKERNQH